MKTYRCTDGNAEIDIQAESAKAAAAEYVAGGDWGGGNETIWVNVWAEEDGVRTRHKIAIEPEAPDCDADEHDWASPIEVVGGIQENPGVMGNGGGVVITEVCRHCGCYRITNTWAQDMSDGTQGLESVEYREADEASLAWVEKEKADNETER